MMRTWRRRRLLIDRLQLRLLTVNLAYTGAIVLTFIGVVFGPLFWTMLDRDAASEARLVAADRMIVMHESLWPPVIVVTLLFVWHSLVYTHRIAGPLYRFRGVFRALERGDFSVRAGTRKRDYLASESEAINAMLDGLQQRVSAVRAATMLVDEATRTLDGRIPGSDPKFRAACHDVRVRTEALVRAVDRFSLDGSESALPVSTPVDVHVSLPLPAESRTGADGGRVVSPVDPVTGTLDTDAAATSPADCGQGG